MKTTCFALLALVSVVTSVPTPQNRFFRQPADFNAPLEIMVPPTHLVPARWPNSEGPDFPYLAECIAEGYFRDPYNCARFYYCSGRNAGSEALYCQPSGFVFDVERNECTNPELVDC